MLVFPHDGQHFVGQPFGQPGFGENQADDDGTENEHDRRVHEILEGHLGRPDQKQGLQEYRWPGW
jgi:hypothetical protein